MVVSTLILFLFGAIFGTLGDYCHVLSNTDGYPTAWISLPGGQPWWVPLLFGSATVSIGLTHLWFDQCDCLKPKRQSTRLSIALLCCLAFFILYSISGFLPLTPSPLRNIVLATSALSVWYFADRTSQGLLLAALIALVGCAVEIGLVHFGAFYYLPGIGTMSGIPTWLPWLYITASIAVGHLADYLKTRKPLEIH